MDYNLIIASLQLALAAFQLKLDHFKSTNRSDDDLEEFYALGEAVRCLEFALSETISFIGQTNNREPNPRLAAIWEDASRTIRNLRNGADLTDLTFEKNLYWRNPQFYSDQSENRLFRISLDNVLIQLRRLRSTFEKVQNKISR